MLGAFICGLVLVSAFSLLILSGERSKDDFEAGVPFGGSPVEIPLPKSFSAIKLVHESADVVNADESGNILIRLSNFEGIEVEMSDSVTAPVLHTDSDWRRVLNITMNGDTLDIRTDFSAVGDSIRNAMDVGIRHFCNINSLQNWPIKVVIPRGMAVDDVKSVYRSVMLKDFNGESVNVATIRRINVANSRIDSLRTIDCGVNYITVENSVINYLYLRCADDLRTGINCVDSNSEIQRMDISGISDDNGRVNLSKANVGSVRWIPADSTATINLILGKPMEMKLK